MWDHMKSRRRKEVLRLDGRLRCAQHFASGTHNGTMLMLALLSVTHVLANGRFAATESRMFRKAKGEYARYLVRPTAQQLVEFEALLRADVTASEEMVTKLLKRAKNL